MAMSIQHWKQRHVTIAQNVQPINPVLDILTNLSVHFPCLSHEKKATCGRAVCGWRWQRMLFCWYEAIRNGQYSWCIAEYVAATLHAGSPDSLGLWGTLSFGICLFALGGSLYGGCLRGDLQICGGMACSLCGSFWSRPCCSQTLPLVSSEPRHIQMWLYFLVLSWRIVPGERSVGTNPGTSSEHFFVCSQEAKGRFCNWSGVSGNGFLGLSKYYIYIYIYIFIYLVDLNCIIGTLLFPPWGNQLVISCIYLSSTMFMDNHMCIIIFTLRQPIGWLNWHHPSIDYDCFSIILFG